MTAAQKIDSALPSHSENARPLARDYHGENALETLQSLAKEIWIVEQDFSTPFMGNIGSRMTVIRLPNNELFIHSPVQLTEHLRRDLVKLGTPRYLIGCSSNNAADFAHYHEAFPAIKMFGTASLLRKLTDITFYGTLTAEDAGSAGSTRPLAAAPWAESIDQHYISGNKDYEELMFFHKPSRTTLVADLFYNLETGESWFQRKSRALFVGENALGISRPVRKALKDMLTRQKAAVWLDAHSPVRIVMNHGQVYEGNAEKAAELLALK